MYIRWNDNSVRWFRDASAYTGFNKKLAERLLRHIENRDTLADLGCGAGLIDMELAPHIGHITCVDINETAVKSVRELAVRCGVANVKATLADAGTLNGKWDSVIALFHGRVETFITKYFDMANDVLIAVVRGNPILDPNIPEHILRGYRTIEQTSEILDRSGIKYTLIPDSLEYGQPFRTREDALLYAQAYSKCRGGESAEDFLDRVLIRTGNPEFPLYMPYEKKFGMYILRKSENRGFEYKTT